jgi:hypothetical protein
MKIVFLLIAFFLFLIVTVNCDHKIDTCPACGVENPTENLPWLKATIQLSLVIDYQSLSKVDLYDYNSQQIVVFTWTLNGVYDLPTGAIYNCDGRLLYACGGNQPVDSCGYIIKNSKYICTMWNK